MRGKKSFLGQSTAEYAILLAIVASALIAMQIYLKRGIQGRIRDLADQISPTHYEPKRTESNYTTTNPESKVISKYTNGISEVRQDGTGGSTAETITRSGYETVYPDEQ